MILFQFGNFNTINYHLKFFRWEVIVSIKTNILLRVTSPRLSPFLNLPVLVLLVCVSQVRFTSPHFNSPRFSSLRFTKTRFTSS